MKLKYIVVSMLLVSIMFTGCGKEVEEQSLNVKYFIPAPTNIDNIRMMEMILNEAVTEVSSIDHCKVELKNGGEGSNDIQKSLREALVKKGDADVIIVARLPLKNIIDKKMVINLKESISNFDEIYDGVKNEYAIGVGQSRYTYFVKKNIGVEVLNGDGWQKVLSAKDKGKCLVNEIKDLTSIVDKNVKYNELFQGNIQSEDLYTRINIFKKNTENRFLVPNIESFDERIQFYCDGEGIGEWNEKCIENNKDQLLAYPTILFDYMDEDEIIKQNKGISDQYELVFSDKKFVTYALIPQNAKNKKMAIEFVNKLTSKEYQNKIYTRPWSEYLLYETNQKVTEEREFESDFGKHIKSSFIEASNQKSQFDYLSLTNFQNDLIGSINYFAFSVAIDPRDLKESKDEILPELKKIASQIKTSNGE